MMIFLIIVCDILSEVERRMYKIVKKQTLNNAVELMEIHAPFVARKCEPGQFIIIRVDEDGERIPLTIADYDREKETVTIIYQVVGYSTDLLSKKQEGDYVQDFVGPLGVPAVLEREQSDRRGRRCRRGAIISAAS